MEEENSYKKMSVVPNEKDFADAILSLKEYQKPYKIHQSRKSCSLAVIHVRNIFSEMLSTVSREFSHLPDLLFDRFNIHHLILAREQLYYGRRLMDTICSDYVRLIRNKDTCNSRDQCKSLKVAALGCMYTLAMRCIPSLAYLDEIRLYMASLPNNLQDDENAPAATTLSNRHCTVPHTFDVHNAADFVDPKTMDWLAELERKQGFILEDDHVDPKTCPHAQGAPTSSMHALAI